MSAHYDDTGACMCDCPFCAPYGCGTQQSAGSYSARCCQHWYPDGTPRRITLTDKRATR